MTLENTYYGECIRCGKHVRNGHGRAGQFTLCPPCCVTHKGCKRCEGIAVELDSPRTEAAQEHVPISGYGIGE